MFPVLPAAAPGAAAAAAVPGAQPAEPNYRPVHRRETSHYSRHLTLTCNEKLALNEAHELLEQVEASIASANRLGQPVPPLWTTQAAELEDFIHMLLTYDEADRLQPIPRQPHERRRIYDVPSGLAVLRNRPSLFETVFGLRYVEVQQLVDAQLLGSAPFHMHKKAPGPTAMLMLVLARLRSTAHHLDMMGELFGVDASFISEFFFQGLMYLRDHHTYRLSQGNLWKWAPHMAKFADAYLRKYNETLALSQLPPVASLPAPRFDGCNVSLDGVRIHICQPTGEIECEFYNSYEGCHNIACIAVTARTG